MVPEAAMAFEDQFLRGAKAERGRENDVIYAVFQLVAGYCAVVNRRDFRSPVSTDIVRMIVDGAAACDDLGITEGTSLGNAAQIILKKAGRLP